MPLIKVEETESWLVLIVLFSKGDAYTPSTCRVHPDERKFVVRAGKLACSLRELSGSHY